MAPSNPEIDEYLARDIITDCGILDHLKNVEHYVRSRNRKSLKEPRKVLGAVISFLRDGKDDWQEYVNDIILQRKNEFLETYDKPEVYADVPDPTRYEQFHFFDLQNPREQYLPENTAKLMTALNHGYEAGKIKFLKGKANIRDCLVNIATVMAHDTLPIFDGKVPLRKFVAKAQVKTELIDSNIFEEEDKKSEAASENVNKTIFNDDDDEIEVLKVKKKVNNQQNKVDPIFDPIKDAMKNLEIYKGFKSTFGDNQYVDWSKVDPSNESTKLMKLLLDYQLILRQSLSNDDTKKEQALEYLKHRDINDIFEAVKETTQLSRVDQFSEEVMANTNDRIGFVPCPKFGTKELDGKLRKDFTHSLGTGVYSNAKNFKVPLRTILELAKATIESNKLSPRASYSLLRSVLDGSSLAFLNTQETMSSPFRSFWIALQALGEKKPNSTEIQSQLHDIKMKPCHDLPGALNKIFSLHSQLYSDFPAEERNKLVIQSSKADALHLIKCNLPLQYQSIIKEERALERAYMSELAELHKSGKEANPENLKTEYHPFLTLLSLVCAASEELPKGNSHPINVLNHDSSSNEHDVMEVNGHYQNSNDRAQNQQNSFRKNNFQSNRSNRGGFKQQNGQDRYSQRGNFNNFRNNNQMQNRDQNQFREQNQDRNNKFGGNQNTRGNNDRFRQSNQNQSGNDRQYGNNQQRNETCKNCGYGHATIKCMRYPDKPGNVQCQICFYLHNGECKGPRRCDWNNFQKPNFQQ